MSAKSRTPVWDTCRIQRFPDRAAAGRALAAQLAAYRERPDTLVLALPRGGVPVAFEVARAIAAPLDLILVRKLGVPGQEELAMGAISEGGLRVLNQDLTGVIVMSPDRLAQITERAASEIARQSRVYRGSRPPPDVRGRTVILVDDGLATGTTMRAAISAVRRQAPAQIVVAAPVAAPETVEMLGPLVDEIVVVETPDSLGAIGLWYIDFAQVCDDEVVALLHQAAELLRSSSSSCEGGVKAFAN
ncbi:MAG: phosphoribosyltransferase [Chloroflexales bacterium]